MVLDEFSAAERNDFAQDVSKKQTSTAKEAAETLGFVSGHDFSRAVND